jgi:hypothetical protein
MGGQACVLYGAAEFSRDTDLAILASSLNLERFSLALDDLGASAIAVPPFHLDYLLRGHAIHFRCTREDVVGMRVDVMAMMRGVDCFEALWERRTTFHLGDDEEIDALALPDLVQAKKTQRDKDWVMLRRLLEVHYFEHRGRPLPSQVRFWCAELRTAALLVELVDEHPEEAGVIASERPLLRVAKAGPTQDLERALAEEEAEEKARDRTYWAPLRKELEEIRRNRHTT